MQNYIFIFIFLIATPLFSDESNKTYGKGLPRDSYSLIPDDSSYPVWEAGEYESVNPQ